MENWRNIKGFEGCYMVSDYGNVKSLDRFVERSNKAHKPFFIKGRILKPIMCRDGYFYVYLRKLNENKYISIHRLVAIEFLENKSDYPCVNHKDENKLNNNASNLEWCSYSYNNVYGTVRERRLKTKYSNKYKITKQQENEIRFIKSLSFDMLSKIYKITVSDIIKLKNNTD